MKVVFAHIVLLTWSVFISAQEVHLPAIPEHVVAPSARTVYLAEHFWECNDIGDTLLMHQPTAILDYIYILKKLPHEKARRFMIETADLAVRYSNTYSYTEYWFECYLHNAQSPYYDDEMLIPFLEHVMESGLDDILKMRTRFLLSRCKLNRVGTLATDFFVHPDGGSDQLLSSIMGKYIILWFFRKGCGACSESADYLRNSEKVKRLSSAGTTVLIPIDVDQFPELMGELYELQYYPSFYILNDKHQVILKEASVDKLDAFLKNI